MLLLLQGISECIKCVGRAFGPARTASPTPTTRRGNDGRRAGRRGVDVSPEWFGILLLGVLFGAIFIGFPIAFTLIAVAVIGGYVDARAARAAPDDAAGLLA